jgi:hypothetical protein
MPVISGVLAPATDSLYILRMKVRKVKPEKLPVSGRFEQ